MEHTVRGCWWYAAMFPFHKHLEEGHRTLSSLYPLQEACWETPSLKSTHVGHCGWGLRWGRVGWGKNRVAQRRGSQLECLLYLEGHSSHIWNSLFCDYRWATVTVDKLGIGYPSCSFSPAISNPPPWKTLCTLHSPGSSACQLCEQEAIDVVP